MKKKPSLHLVKDKAVEYEVVKLSTCNGEMFEFSLNDFEMWESDEWIEFKKKDVLECFPIQNISHISFVNKGGESVGSGPKLTPVA